jgi:hypothetical protein
MGLNTQTTSTPIQRATAPATGRGGVQSAALLARVGVGVGDDGGVLHVLCGGDWGLLLSLLASEQSGWHGRGERSDRRIICGTWVLSRELLKEFVMKMLVNAKRSETNTYHNVATRTQYLLHGITI